jgi:HEAT repeat protein
MPLFGPPEIEKLKAKRDVKGLVKALGYKEDVEIRRKAAIALGELKDTAAVDALLSMLEDSNIRCDAAEALGNIGDPRATEPMIAMLNRSDQPMRKAVINALGLLGDPRAIEALTAALDDKEQRIRDTAASALGRLGWQPTKDTHGAVYWIFVGKFDKCIEIGAPACEPLLAYLKVEGGLYKAAIDALGQLGDARAVEPLIAVMMGKETYIGVCSAAATALGKLGDRRAVAPLFAAFKDLQNPAHNAAITALRQLGDPSLVEPLIETLKDRALRRDAARMLGDLGDPRALEPLMALLQDFFAADVHPAVAYALGKLGDRRAVDLLASEINSDTLDLPEAAAEALARIGEPLSIQGVIQALIAQLDGKRRVSAARALVAMYRAGTMDARSKETILGLRDQITIPHQDLDRHRDLGDRGCPGHEDDVSHSDEGIGVDFPL